ncbi:hypothetical protein B0J14DRAFT_685587 [Halenospora varia]|nr:hypothetical protein B0J14DRAFT_685587 [Halenospora varia]
MTNLVGIKPTVGLKSRALVISISEHQDTVGPTACTVMDAAYALSVIVVKDTNDNCTNVFSPSSTNGPISQAFEDSIQVLKRAGAIILDNANYSAYHQYLADSSGADKTGVVLPTDEEGRRAHFSLLFLKMYPRA